ncbi:MAG: hypothetical protein P8101_21265 [Candidatus Thiodiazotropha sp.]
MDKESINEILACLTQDRTCYHYFKNRYALQLLGYVSGNGAAIERLRRSDYAPLLNKTTVRQVLGDCGDGRIDRQRTNAHWESPSLPFLLTLGEWGDRHWFAYHQTSRPGFNLVLRLNFSYDHDQDFQRLFRPYYRDDSLNWFGGHPVMKSGERRYYRQTLAWARLDVDLAQGEALIEEIQTDWVREANDTRRRLPRCQSCRRTSRSDHCHRVLKARRYLDEVLSPYIGVWDEAMLSATLFFLHEELGLSRIWYHTWECGNAMKGIRGDSAPPRSIYQKLPRRFCFSETDQMPRMLRNRASERRLRQARVPARFYQLNLKENGYAGTTQTNA